MGRPQLFWLRAKVAYIRDLGMEWLCRAPESPEWWSPCHSRLIQPWMIVEVDRQDSDELALEVYDHEEAQNPEGLPGWPENLWTPSLSQESRP